MKLFTRNFFNFYKFSFKQKHRLGVSTGIIHKNNILLIRRENEPFKNKWCFPGGKIEKDENYIDATIREVAEETGLSVRLPEIHLLKIVYVGEYILFTSIAEITDNNFKIVDRTFTYDNIKSQWFTPEEISKLDLTDFAPGIKELIPKAFKLSKLNYVEI